MKKYRTWQGRVICMLSGAHRSESGAVLLLGLAGVLITMLLGWAMMDAGYGTRHKVMTQSASDAAAFSQAAIKARSMNMMAYSNIAKRSIWGVHSLYPSYLKSMYDWIYLNVEESCQECDDAGDSTHSSCELCRTATTEAQRWVSETCGGTRCSEVGGDPNDERDWGFFRHLHGEDYARDFLIFNSGQSAFVDPWRFTIHDVGATKGLFGDDDPYRSLVDKYYANDIRALDNYQRYMYGLTPWWAWVEQLVRGVRNGATLSSSWPSPTGVWPLNVEAMIQRAFDEFRRLYADQSIAPYGTVYTDSLPVYPGEVGSMRNHIWDAVGGADTAFITTLIGCVTNAIGMGGSCNWGNFSPFLIEHLVNGIIFTLKSTGVLAFEYGVNVGRCNFALIPGPICIHRNALFSNDFRDGLRYTENSFENILNDTDTYGGRREHIAAEPWLLRPQRDAQDWQRSTSNIVLTYRTRFGVHDDSRDRSKFNILDDYRDNTFEGLRRRAVLYGDDRGPAVGVDLLRQELTYGASGVWSMSRSEIFFDGDTEPTLWRPSWSGRLRPVALAGEMGSHTYMMNQVYRDAVPGFVMASVLGITSLADVRNILSDMAFMDKAVSAMTNTTTGGLGK